MTSSLDTLGVVQRARAEALPQRIAASPFRVTALEGFRRRNAALDAIFYDVTKVKQEEAEAIGPWYAAEGAILIVPPTNTGTLLTLCPTIDDFFDKGGANLRVLAVAGVGSSALGSAAFARNVADALGEPIAAVVSGYGLADLITEGLGGWFWFGTVNRLRHAFEFADRLTESSTIAETALQPHESHLTPLRLSRDTRTVRALLNDERLKLKLLTGHSKGNLVLAEALYEIKADDPGRLDQLVKSTKIVTVSAVISVPSAFRGVIDVIGGLDNFGALNSTPFLLPELIIPGAWHHTNTKLPASLSVTRAFEALVSRKKLEWPRLKQA